MYNNCPERPDETVWDLFERYDWPGNVRELENTVKSMVALEDASMVLDDLEKKVSRNPNSSHDNLFKHLSDSGNGGKSLKQITDKVAEDAEKSIIKQALFKSSGNKKLAAKMLGVSYKCLLNKVKEYGI
jgi:two-component system response regulator AtoC